MLLRSLVDRFTDLADNAQAFMGSLHRTIDLHDADADAFRAYKDWLIGYLERFIADLVTTGGEIATLVADIDDVGVHQLLNVAAGREAQDAAPGDGPDGDDDPRRQAFERGRATWQERWRGLRHWFVPESAVPARRSCCVHKPALPSRSYRQSSPASTNGARAFRPLGGLPNPRPVVRTRPR